MWDFADRTFKWVLFRPHLQVPVPHTHSMCVCVCAFSQFISLQTHLQSKREATPVEGATCCCSCPPLGAHH